MTKAQRNQLVINYWPAACKNQGWTVSDRDLRLRVLSIGVFGAVQSVSDFRLKFESFSGPFLQSANEIDHDRQYTAVKSLLLMLADNLKGTQEVGEPEINKARQKRHRILQLMGELARFPSAQPMGLDGAEAYVCAIIEGKFKRLIPIEELTIEPKRFIDRNTGKQRIIPSQLDQLLITLNARINGYRSREQDPNNNKLEAK